MPIVFALIVVSIIAGAVSPASAQVSVSCFDSHQRLAGARTPNPHGYPVVAHKHLAFGTIVEFFRTLEDQLENNGVKFIVMDRGPFWKDRVFDLDCGASHAARFPETGVLHYRVLGHE